MFSRDWYFSISKNAKKKIVGSYIICIKSIFLGLAVKEMISISACESVQTCIFVGNVK